MAIIIIVWNAKMFDGYVKGKIYDTIMEVNISKVPMLISNIDNNKDRNSVQSLAISRSVVGR